MKKTLISVVMPCYNSERFIINSLISLQNQTYKNLQIILVDDQSTDNTLSIITDFAKGKDNFEVYVNQKKGVSSARNTGIDKAKGEYIAFMDSDDILSPYHIENLYTALSSTGADLSICAYKKSAYDKTYDKIKFKKPDFKRYELYDKVTATQYFLAQKKFEFSVWNKLYSTKIIKENNVSFVEYCRYNEDSLFNYKYLKVIDKTVFVPFPTYYYVQTKNSLVRRGFNEYKLDAYISLNGILHDAYNNFPEVKEYAHAIRVALTCEILFFIKRSKYNNRRSIRKIIEYATEDCKHLKYCKHVKLYRRLFIPLVPTVAKILLAKRISPSIKEEFSLPAWLDE